MNSALSTEDSESQLERLDAAGRLRWALERVPFKNTIATTSFGVESPILLHLISQVTPRLQVVFIDTGYHFPETLAFGSLLTERLGLNLKTVSSPPSHKAYRSGQPWGSPFAAKSWCWCRKVEAMEQVLTGVGLWISGLRRSQSESRKKIQFLDRLATGQYKLNPLADWDDAEAKHYARRHRLPVHPLKVQGYESVGCWPCTSPSKAAGGGRDGRWAGETREECGIHTEFRSEGDSGGVSA